MSSPIPVVVAGALGRMGAEVIRAVLNAEDCHLVGAIDNTPGKEGVDVGLELGSKNSRSPSQPISKVAFVP
jgi:4-hydroxy-tetrahydrodipicolinate reductase